MFCINFQNFGSIKEGEVKLNKITIFCGGNNTGKTYASYAIYDLIKSLDELHGEFISLNDNEDMNEYSTIFDLNEVLDSLDKITMVFSQKFSNRLYRLFSTNKDFFKGSKVTLKIDENIFEEYLYQLDRQYNISFLKSDLSIDIAKPEGSLDLELSYTIDWEDEDSSEYAGDFLSDFLNEEINELIFDKVLKKDAFLLPAERSGLNLFYKELNDNRNEIIHELGIQMMDKGKKINTIFLKDLSKKINPYAKPISDYISFLNSKHKHVVEPSDFEDIAKEVMENILNGMYKIIEDDIFFEPITNNREANKPISLHVSSSTAKTLYGLVYYLNYIAEEGQYLIIDEPELNLHPDNQRKLARVLAKIANRGINIILSTHSDYIIKEFNNLLLLSNSFESKKELMNKYGYSEDEIFNKKDISPYVFFDGQIHEMEIDELGMIHADTFNNVINQYNDSVDDIYFTLQYELDKDSEDEQEYE